MIARIMLHAIIVAAMIVVVHGKATCDYRLVQESKYSGFNLSSVGITTDTSICMNGFMSGAGGTSIEAFVAQSEEYVRALAIKDILPKVKGGANTTSQIMLDIEKPVDRRKFHHPGRNCPNKPCYNDTLAAAVAKALALRVKVAHDVFPHAKISLYGTTVNTEPWEMGGYLRMAALGAYDGVDYIVPVLYLGTGMNATNHTSYVLSASSMITDTSGTPIPMAPLMSWIWFGNPHRGCEISFAQAHEMLDVIATWNETRLPIVSFWSGSDTSGSNTTCGAGHPSLTQFEWMTQAQIVPERCLHH